MPFPEITLRDFLWIVLTGVILVALFSPILGFQLSIEEVMISGILTGYITNYLSTQISYWFFFHVSGNFRDLAVKLEKLGMKWNFDKLFAMMRADDRSYLTDLDGYQHFYMFVSFYLFLYFMFNFSNLLINGIVAVTPFVGKISIPSSVLCSVSLLTSYACLKNCISYLDTRNYYYEEKARLYQEKSKKLTKLFGKIVDSDLKNPVNNAKVTMKKNKETFECFSDLFGCYSFKSESPVFINVSALGYEDYSFTQLTESQEVKLSFRQGIIGQVTALIDGNTRGIGNARVQIFSPCSNKLLYESLANTEGKFRIGTEDQGIYYVRIFANGYKKRNIPVVKAGQDLKEIKLTKSRIYYPIKSWTRKHGDHLILMSGLFFLVIFFFAWLTGYG